MRFVKLLLALLCVALAWCCGVDARPVQAGELLPKVRQVVSAPLRFVGNRVEARRERVQARRTGRREVRIGNACN